MPARPPVALFAPLAVAAATLVLAARPAAAGTPADFVDDARLMARAVACGGEAPLPADLDAKIIDAHCAKVAPWYPELDQKYLTRAREFLDGVRPAGLPTTVVYPFGGGDLLTALLTFPEATEITTLSLEHAGDPTRLTSASTRQLRSALAIYRSAVRQLFVNHDSASDNMKKLEKGAVPGQLSFFITALVALGYEPVGLRFFRVEPDGSLHYYDAAEVDSLADTQARRKKASWVDTDYSVVFTNSELSFRRAGDPAAPVIVHRHIAFNLNDQALPGSGVEKYLEQRGKVAAMTKAASYLLWLGSFATIRDYLLANAVWMISDSTGIPPRYARKAGMTQTTYGRFKGSYLEAGAGDNEAFRKLWGGQPYRKLKFRYGYPDVEGNVHLMITAPKAPPPRPAPAPKAAP